MLERDVMMESSLWLDGHFTENKDGDRKPKSTQWMAGHVAEQYALEGDFRRMKAAGRGNVAAKMEFELNVESICALNRLSGGKILKYLYLRFGHYPGATLGSDVNVKDAIRAAVSAVLAERDHTAPKEDWEWVLAKTLIEGGDNSGTGRFIMDAIRECMPGIETDRKAAGTMVLLPPLMTCDDVDVDNFEQVDEDVDVDVPEQTATSAMPNPIDEPAEPKPTYDGDVEASEKIFEYGEDLSAIYEEKGEVRSDEVDVEIDADERRDAKDEENLDGLIEDKLSELYDDLTSRMTEDDYHSVSLVFGKWKKSGGSVKFDVDLDERRDAIENGGIEDLINEKFDEVRDWLSENICSNEAYNRVKCLTLGWTGRMLVPCEPETLPVDQGEHDKLNMVGRPDEDVDELNAVPSELDTVSDCAELADSVFQRSDINKALVEVTQPGHVDEHTSYDDLVQSTINDIDQAVINFKSNNNYYNGGPDGVKETIKSLARVTSRQDITEDQRNTLNQAMVDACNEIDAVTQPSLAKEVRESESAASLSGEFGIADMMPASAA